MKITIKKNEDMYFNPLGKTDRSTVLQETRFFRQNGLNVRQARLVLTKFLYLINEGHRFSVTEATSLFFDLTLLFQSKDASLRRLLYLAIKELTNAEHILMATSCLTKDISGKDDNYRAAAIRALVTITNQNDIQGIERLLKQAIVDKNPSVSSAALVSALRLANKNLDIVKRWSSEIQESINSRSVMVQYHALGLLYHIKQHDRLAIMKLVVTCTRGSHVLSCSSFASVMLIRYVAKILEETDDLEDQKHFNRYLEYSLRDSNEMVMYEAARTICSLPRVEGRLLAMAVSVLQLFLMSSQDTLRFAAVKTLSKAATRFPLAVATCNLDLETLIQDHNKTVAVLAITTLLKTGSESSIDRLIQQIHPLLESINDDFKAELCGGFGELALKFPQRHATIIRFLATSLRDQGGHVFKSAVVETLVKLINALPDAKEVGLLHLCEFIEDCEYALLCTRVLRFLGDECPSMPRPSQYIRYIHNRVVLESACVRAAAVSALAKFAVKRDELVEPILVLLSRCKFDTDDEVRDRSTLFVALLSEGCNSKLLLAPVDLLPVSPGILERFLLDYLEKGDFSEKLDLHNIPHDFEVQSSPEVLSPLSLSAAPPASLEPSSALPLSAASAQGKAYERDWADVPELEALGQVYKSSKPVMLTESETEFVVSCVKHVLDDHLVLQFVVTNTINDAVLQDLTVLVRSNEDFRQVFVRPVSVLSGGETKSVFVVLARAPSDTTCFSAVFSNTLKFVFLESEVGGLEDEYKIENLHVTVADYIHPEELHDFSTAWDQLDDAAEVVHVVQLPHLRSLEKTTVSLSKQLGRCEKIFEILRMYSCDNTDRVSPETHFHVILLAGRFCGDLLVLVRAKMALQANSGVTIQLAIRSVSSDLSSTLFTEITKVIQESGGSG